MTARLASAILSLRSGFCTLAGWYPKGFVTHRISFHAVVLAATIACSSSFAYTAAQSLPRSPSDTVREFYKAMHEKRFTEAWEMTIYKPAVEGLTRDQIEDLRPYFEEMAAKVPAQVEIASEQTGAHIATVLVKVPNLDDPEKPALEPVTLLRAGNAWIIGDEANQALVQRAGNKYFFDARIDAHHTEVEGLLKRILAVEIKYSQNHGGKFADLAALANAALMPSDDLESTGYRFHLRVANDGKTYVAGAEPARYGRTGRLSFWMDQTGEIISADHGGKPLSAPK